MDGMEIESWSAGDAMNRPVPNCALTAYRKIAIRFRLFSFFVQKASAPNRPLPTQKTQPYQAIDVLSLSRFSATLARVTLKSRPATADYVESGLVVPDDYVYYPAYQVYYSSNRRHYIYRDGHSWVTRPVPPHVSVGVLSASPSVRLDFHDHPSIHHATVVRQYPKRWVPPESSPKHNRGYRDDGK